MATNRIVIALPANMNAKNQKQASADVSKVGLNVTRENEKQKEDNKYEQLEKSYVQYSKMRQEESKNRKKPVKAVTAQSFMESDVLSVSSGSSARVNKVLDKPSKQKFRSGMHEALDKQDHSKIDQMSA